MTNPINAVLPLQNATTMDAPRNVGGNMGKNDFLMLLVAQLRHQNPLEPANDSEFASQLAQFSSLEQLENMNQSMSAMSLHQSFGLVGKFVVGLAVDADGEPMEIPGVVESIFTREGITYAQIGEYVIPLSAVRDVFDSSDLVTPRLLVEMSNSLIGRFVRADYVFTEETEDEDGEIIKTTKPKQIEGFVTRVIVEEAQLYAFIDDGSEKEIKVPVGAIHDIGKAGAAA